MAHILLGWELGGNRGHADKLLQLREAFLRRGHSVVMALQRVDALSREGAGGFPLWQAPVWPRLLRSVSRHAARPTRTMADILAKIGLADDGAFATMLAAWDSVLAAERPDIVVAEYAPALLQAAKGRAATIATGTGFTLPPSDLATFPNLLDGGVGTDERAMLAQVNAALERSGRQGVAALPEIFAADRALAGSIKELDPYARWRTEPCSLPGLSGPCPPIANGEGAEIFVYWSEHAGDGQPLWEALRRVEAPIRAYVPGISEVRQASLERLGVIVERSPVPFDLISRRSRLVLSYGSAGFTHCALIAGLPQIAVPTDLEKQVHARALAEMKVGGWILQRNIQAESFAAATRALYEDEAMAARARAKAGELAVRLAGGDWAEEAAIAVDGLG